MEDELNWQDLFRLCAERFGWPPQVVLELTPLEAAMVLGVQVDQPRRTVWMSPQQVQAFLASKKDR